METYFTNFESEMAEKDKAKDILFFLRVLVLHPIEQ